MATRREKFPDTETFKFYNANPHNRITSDCVIRAISTALGKEYNECYKELFELSLKKGYMVNSLQCYEKYLKEKGYDKQKQPKKEDGTKYTGEEFCKIIDKKKRYIAHIGNQHIVAIVEGKIHDTWNSTRFTIGNYWEIKD